MQLRPRINSLEKNYFYDLSGVPNTGSSGIFNKKQNLNIQNHFSSTTHGQF
jgi:hypothetical protein